MPSTLLTLGAGAAAALAGLAALARYRNKKDDPLFGEQVLQDAARWLAQKKSVDPGAVEQALRACLAGQPPSPILDGLRRIEFEVVRKPTHDCDRTVMVLLRTDSDLAVGKVTRNMAWEDLSSHIRTALIRGGSASATFLFLDLPRP